jgi:hypothetical protein
MPSQPEHIGHQRISRQTVEGRMTWTVNCDRATIQATLAVAR